MAAVVKRASINTASAHRGVHGSHPAPAVLPHASAGLPSRSSHGRGTPKELLSRPRLHALRHSHSLTARTSHKNRRGLPSHRTRTPVQALSGGPSSDSKGKGTAANGEVYSNFFTSLLGNLLPGGRTKKEVVLPPALQGIDWEAPKATGLSIEELCEAIDREFRVAGREWFVTGNAPPEYFADDFLFKDPDVQVEGIKRYCAGVAKLFDAETARAETISCRVTGADTIVLAWRLSGKVNLGPGLELKPYVVTTELRVDGAGLVCYQEDEFDAPGWDILLSAVLPGLRRFLRPAAPPVEELRAAAEQE